MPGRSSFFYLFTDRSMPSHTLLIGKFIAILWHGAACPASERQFTCLVSGIRRGDPRFHRGINSPAPRPPDTGVRYQNHVPVGPWLDSAEEKMEDALETVAQRSDWFAWARSSGLYISREELIELQSRGLAVVVDTRDDDVAGGRITGAMHLADSTFRAAQVRTVLEEAARRRAAASVVDGESVQTIVFHCMESARRGPRCARRLVVAMEALRKEGCTPQEVPEVRVRVLEGGFDQWVRRYWRDPARVEGYDDNYWGYAEMAEAGSTSLFSHDAPLHKSYERPADQPATPWSAAGVSTRAAAEGEAPSDS